MALSIDGFNLSGERIVSIDLRDYREKLATAGINSAETSTVFLVSLPQSGFMVNISTDNELNGHRMQERRKYIDANVSDLLHAKFLPSGDCLGKLQT